MECVFGVVGRDFAVVAAGTSVVQSILVHKNDEGKIMLLDSHMVLGASSEPGDRNIIFLFSPFNITMNQFMLHFDTPKEFVRRIFAGRPRSRGVRRPSVRSRIAITKNDLQIRLPRVKKILTQMKKNTRNKKYSCRQLRSSHYQRPCSRCSFKRVANQESTLTATEKCAWKDAICPVCMECPHDAVLLLCSSHGNGCSYIGTYRELRKHVRKKHLFAKHRTVDPVHSFRWRQLLFRSALQDMICATSSSTLQRLLCAMLQFEELMSSVWREDDDRHGAAMDLAGP